ncbi:hypothetical protein HGRIS_008250 [Hohenbuehelia grisea]|uniref:DUF605-domain-containing protein n=1 Tax=Hohenbuehelia grisea TaxID=104357 RepID=A0ABR3J7U6_9AGAR
MAAPRLLGLPPISPELKAISPFLQRADELQKQDPIMAYWCTYHAAQVGISIKAKDNASRNVLFDLLGVLERMKEEIGPSDAVDVEAASAAYVENFALRVFNMADNEDRKGNATRSTAKKFLAAANFLEVLKVFPQTYVTDTNEEKARYARWKAVDIAKAFREGRQPTAGPAGSELPVASSPKEPTKLPSPPPFNSHPTTSSTQTNTASSSSSHSRPHTSSSHTSPSSSPQFKPSTPPHLKRISPPPQMDPADIARANLLHTPPKSAGQFGLSPQPGDAQGSWSTVATPGMTDVFEDDDDEARAHQKATSKGKRRDSGSPSSRGSPPKRGHKRVSSNESDGGHTKKAVHFTSSVAGTSPPTQGSPTIHSAVRDSGVDFGVGFGSPGSRGVIPPPPPPFQTPSEPTSPTVYRHLKGSPPRSHAAYPPASPPSLISHPNPPSPPSSELFARSIPLGSAVIPPPPIPSAPPQSAPIELTPAIITKVQKHCRFAISSLDYEDAEQARKELRAALAILGE